MALGKVGKVGQRGRVRFILTVLVCWGFATTVLLNEAKAQTDTVPFRKTERGLLLVDVRINDQGPFPFLIDTGATTSVVFEPLADQLRLTRTRDTFAMVHGIVESGEHPLARLRTLRIGKAQLTDLEAIVLKSPSVQRDWMGIIGLNFLSEFIFVFDNSGQTLTLYKHDDLPQRTFSGWRRLPVYHDTTLKRPFKLLFVPVRVDGKKLDALIDLGSTTLILNWPGARLIGFERLYRRLEEKWLVEGATGEFRPRTVIKDAEIKIGRLSAEGSMLIVDTKALRELNRHETPFLILSAGLFGRGSFAVDVATPAFYLKPRSTVRPVVITR